MVHSGAVSRIDVSLRGPAGPGTHPRVCASLLLRPARLLSPVVGKVGNCAVLPGSTYCSNGDHTSRGSNVNWKCVGEVQGPQGCSSSTVQPNGCSFRVAAVKAAWQYYLAASFHTSLLPDVGSKIRIQDSSRVQLLDYVHSKVVSTQRDTSAFDWRNDGDVLPDTLFTGFILLQGADDELCPLPGQDQLFLVFGAWPHPAHCWLHVSAYDMAFHWQ